MAISNVPYPGIGSNPFLFAGMQAARIYNDWMNTAAESLTRMASGMRINSAADDPAGLSISENLRAEVRGLNRASMNALDEIGMVQTADAALQEVHNSLQNINELSVYAANGVLTADDRGAIQQQIDAEIDHINTITATAEFNEQPLLSGGLGFDSSASSIGIAGLNVMDPGLAGEAISTTQNAISQISEYRTGLGAMQNSLEANVRYLDNAMVNTMAAESRIRDLDYAMESVNLTNSLIMADLTGAALAQANLQAKSMFGLL